MMEISKEMSRGPQGACGEETMEEIEADLAEIEDEIRKDRLAAEAMIEELEAEKRK